LISAVSATKYYELDKKYEGATFFDEFDFFPTFDPTHGYVTYGDRNYAESNNLIETGAVAKMKVDSTTVLTPPANGIDGYWEQNNVGRKSVRIETQKSWTEGLIIGDFLKMPSSSVEGCGTWPAFWTLGSGDWPYNGELDILEGANNQKNNFAAGHTGSQDKTRQCKINNAGGTGQIINDPVGVPHDNCNLWTTVSKTNHMRRSAAHFLAGSLGKPNKSDWLPGPEQRT
jgi:beta-glucanase (GH16 family)